MLISIELKNVKGWDWWLYILFI